MKLDIPTHIGFHCLLQCVHKYKQQECWMIPAYNQQNTCTAIYGEAV